MRIDAALEITDDELAAVLASRKARGLPACHFVAGPRSELTREARVWWIRELSILATAADRHGCQVQASTLRHRAAVLARTVAASWPPADAVSGFHQIAEALAGRGDDPPSMRSRFTAAEERALGEFLAFLRIHGRPPQQVELRSFAKARGVSVPRSLACRLYAKLSVAVPPRTPGRQAGISFSDSGISGAC